MAMLNLSREESFRLLDEVDVGHIAVVADGQPYVTPISFVRRADRLIMRTAQGKRLDALRVDPRACFEVSEVDPETGDWESVVVNGTVSEIHDDVAEAEAVALLLEKYRRLIGPVTAWTVPELLPGAAVVLRLAMTEVTGRSSGSGLSRSMRPGRL
jgi:nitroimidazol reductase NimA-like FMN-containing flavoprotein (pyridoxamine 5'-phosphate oxidase superfamily)